MNTSIVQYADRDGFNYLVRRCRGVWISGLHNIADHRTIGPRKCFRLAEKMEGKT
jgi:hypothetical protein